MFSLISRLFHLYCDHHFALLLPGFEIIDGDGEKRGQIERICYGRHSLRVEGWCAKGRVALTHPGDVHWETPNILRADVNAALGLRAEQRCGFNLACYGKTQGVFLLLKKDNTTLQIQCPHPAWRQRVSAQIHIRISFARDVIRAAPALIRAYFSPNSVSRQKAKRAMRIGDCASSLILDASVFHKSVAAKNPKKLTLILPIFNAADVLGLALTRIVENTDVPWRLILVEDCSTDPAVRPMVRRWRDTHSILGHEIYLLENRENLGFIKSVNRAFKVALEHSDHAVLINSDALVPKGWASRLIHPIMTNASVASVTPLSNDAEVFSVPVICKNGDIIEGAGDQIDRSLRAHISIDACKSAPTGVGFCMAINNRFLRKLPEFDTAFGRGYGEEVDWCQKALALGGLHMCQPALFVEHRGGASFGSVEKQASIARNNQRITKRHPQFDQAVQHFIATDPLVSARLLAGIAHLDASQDRVQIYIAHSLGGGAELYLQEKITVANAGGQGIIVLRVGGTLRWRIELYTGQGKVFADTGDFGLLKTLLSPISCGEIYYSCAVGDSDPVGLSHEITVLQDATNANLIVLVHDYFLISPSYCLLDSDGTYGGIPSLDHLDAAHEFSGSDGTLVRNVTWRSTWCAVLQRADRIVCFSESSRVIMSQAFPQLSTEIEVRPHRIAPMRNAKIADHVNLTSVGILGDIGFQKGADVLCRLSPLLPLGGVRNLVIVGRVDPSFPLGERCVETGTYERTDIPLLMEKHGIAAWVIPSIWPETFSYTTHEALATGLPVFAFDIGAQGEAVAREANGYPMPFAWAAEPEKILTFIHKELADGALNQCVDPSLEGGGYRGFAA